MSVSSEKSSVLSLAVLDSCFRVAAPEAFTAIVADLWHAFPRTTAARVEHALRVKESAPGYLVELDGTTASAADIPAAVGYLGLLVNRICLSEVTVPAFHAAVLAGSAGAVVVLGTSGAGKTTLAAAAAQRGLRYLSDEAFVLEAKNRARPYPRPLSLSRWAAELLGIAAPSPWRDSEEILVSPRSLGPVASEAAEVRHLVVLDRTQRELALRAAERSLAVTGLLRLSFNHFRAPEDTYRDVITLARACECWQLSYDDPRDGARLIEELVT